MLRIILTVWLVHLGVALAPGVNFALVGQTAVAHNRRAALLVAAGILTATLVWLTAALVGIAGLLERSQTVFQGLRVFGAIYLIWLGARRLLPRRSNVSSVDVTSEVARPGRHYTNGLIANLENPKSVIFYGSLFAAAIPPGTPTWVKLAAASTIVANTVAIHGGLARLLSVERIRIGYERISGTLERVFGVLFVGFGLKLLRSD